MEKVTVESNDYDRLVGLAESRGFRCVEARGLDTRRGLRFSRDGQEWIVIDPELSVQEKARAVGFLLENTPADAAVRAGLYKDPAEASSAGIVHTLCC